MKKILFITGNKRKIWQAETCLSPFGIEIEAQDLDVHEIQSPDPLEISHAKAEAAYKLAKQPLVICDHSWSAPALKGFPGGYMKDANHWFEPEDFLALMKDKTDKSITLTETVVYTDGKTMKEFSVLFPAHFIDEIRGQGSVSMERVVAFDGNTKTIAEAIDAGEHAREMLKSAWNKFGEWFVNE